MESIKVECSCQGRGRGRSRWGTSKYFSYKVEKQGMELKTNLKKCLMESLQDLQDSWILLNQIWNAVRLSCPKHLMMGSNSERPLWRENLEGVDAFFLSGDWKMKGARFGNVDVLCWDIETWLFEFDRDVGGIFRDLESWDYAFTQECRLEALVWLLSLQGLIW